MYLTNPGVCLPRLIQISSELEQPSPYANVNVKRLSPFRKTDSMEVRCERTPKWSTAGWFLQMHFACQGSVAPRIGTCDRLTFWRMAEVFLMEMLVQVAVAMERPRALHYSAGSSLSPRQKNTPGGFAIMREGFGKSWPACPLGQAWCPTRSDGAFATAGTRRSCELRSAVTALMVCTRRLHSASGDEVVEGKRLLMTPTRSTKT